MQIKANSPEEYIKAIPKDRQKAFGNLRRIILENLPKGLEECMSYGMIGYVVPHSIYPSGYHCDTKLPLPFMSIASQKNFVAFYHSGIYADEAIKDWFVSEYPKHCQLKLDMGKSCVRFKKVDQIPLDLMVALVSKISVKDWIDLYERKSKK